LTRVTRKKTGLASRAFTTSKKKMFAGRTAGGNEPPMSAARGCVAWLTSKKKRARPEKRGRASSPRGPSPRGWCRVKKGGAPGGASEKGGMGRAGKPKRPLWPVKKNDGDCCSDVKKKRGKFWKGEGRREKIKGSPETATGEIRTTTKNEFTGLVVPTPADADRQKKKCQDEVAAETHCGKTSACSMSREQNESGLVHVERTSKIKDWQKEKISKTEGRKDEI